MAAPESIADAGIVSEFRPGSARFVAPTDALIADWLILPEWIPQLPKRAANSYDWPDGWWGQSALDADDWTRPRVGGWWLRRRKGGLFEITVSIPARDFPRILAAPEDHEPCLAMVARHRQMVRARRDPAFQRLLERCLASVQPAQRSA